MHARSYFDLEVRHGDTQVLLADAMRSEEAPNAGDIIHFIDAANTHRTMFVQRRSLSFGKMNDDKKTQRLLRVVVFVREIT